MKVNAGSFTSSDYLVDLPSPRPPHLWGLFLGMWGVLMRGVYFEDPRELRLGTSTLLTFEIEDRYMPTCNIEEWLGSTVMIRNAFTYGGDARLRISNYPRSVHCQATHGAVLKNFK
jgi:hypothetical protein